MSIHIPKMPPPSAGALRALESWLGCELHPAYVEFVSEHDGARPEENSLSTRDNEVGVLRFIPVSEAAALAQEIDGFPDGALPLGEDGSGNYFYVEPRSGHVSFWDHEVEGDELVAPDVSPFVTKLMPFDVASVKLAPGQVRHAWIDPDFLAELKKDGAA